MRPWNTLKAAFPHTIPVMTGYLFLGCAFGILLAGKGYGALWAGFMSTVVFAGSIQYVAVDLLAQAVSVASAFLVALMVNARHIFYGFSMLEKFSDAGRLRPYLIFALSDETFTLLYATEPPEGISRKWFCFCIALLDQLYWVAGSVVGGLIGANIPFDVKGIDFVMTALFVAIFVEQCRERQNRIPAAVGLGGSALCLLLLGRENFLLTAMIVMVVILTAIRRPVERRMTTP